MTSLIFIAADLAAISILTVVLYLRRHRRRDLVVSYLGMNVGVLGVIAGLGTDGHRDGRRVHRSPGPRRRRRLRRPPPGPCQKALYQQKGNSRLGSCEHSGYRRILERTSGHGHGRTP
ncbi:DUF4956 domain-containing protein [Pseudarthrobacter sp. S3]|uniref:DUF4956 domain-containing protein n=1 Tax=unclassified Pseudarthrobacter TaxID=2647000 RepID=UPI00349BA777